MAYGRAEVYGMPPDGSPREGPPLHGIAAPYLAGPGSTGRTPPLEASGCRIVRCRTHWTYLTVWSPGVRTTNPMPGDRTTADHDPNPNPNAEPSVYAVPWRGPPVRAVMV